MTDNNKPEWFEIAENDGPAQPKKVRRSLPIAAVMAIALVIGVGAVVAQTQEESPANATETTSVANEQVVTPSPEEATQSVATPQQSSLVNPNIAKLPSGGERDGEDGDRPRRGHHDENEDDDEGEGE